MMSASTSPSQPQWLVFVHQLPAHPAYRRVKIWRRLQAMGAVNLKGAVYLLPHNAALQEAFTSILKDVEDSGGEGVLYEARHIAGMRDDRIRQLFNEARDTEYQAIADELRLLSQTWQRLKKPKSDPVQSLSRMSMRLAELNKIDFFGASGRRQAEALLSALEHSRIANASVVKVGAEDVGLAAMRGKTWVTRQDIHVDRIACAWLIKRFIDPKGSLKFVSSKSYQPQAGEFRYDMQGAEFTHEGDNCSFETLMTRARIKDGALKIIAEIIHDIDIQDGKYGHPETAGIATVISALCRAQGSDEVRVERGKELLDELYEQIRRRKSHV
ncbi:MAG TPA: chromate resistance protein ChrB domain-containing protein [Rhizomicrobium sp.]|nr:chromate resistance protein ChrB domain-containing protein [Rhizomicrobium sp.]